VSRQARDTSTVAQDPVVSGRYHLRVQSPACLNKPLKRPWFQNSAINKVGVRIHSIVIKPRDYKGCQLYPDNTVYVLGLYLTLNSGVIGVKAAWPVLRWHHLRVQAPPCLNNVGGPLQIRHLGERRPKSRMTQHWPQAKRFAHIIQHVVCRRANSQMCQRVRVVQDKNHAKEWFMDMRISCDMRMCVYVCVCVSSVNLFISYHLSNTIRNNYSQAPYRHSLSNPIHRASPSPLPSQ